MDKRIKKIFNLLSENEYKTAKNLSEKLNISSKTARMLLKELDIILVKNGAEIVSKSGYGYLLKINDRKRFLSFDISKKDRMLPVTSEERIQYIIEYMINIKNYIKIEDLSKMLFISAKTLAKDLKEIEKILDEYNIKLERKPYYGIKLKGTEFDLRLCIADYIERKTLNKEKTDFIDENELKKIAEIIIGTLEKEKFHISDVAFQNLIIHIQIAIKRIEKKCHIPIKEEELKNFIGERELETARKCTDKLEKTFQIIFPDSEINYIAIHLAGKKFFSNSEYSEYKEENFVIDQEIGIIISEMMRKIYKAFKFDFSRDLELRIALAQHLMPLRIRMRFDMKMKNPLLDKIKERFSLAFTMAKYASTTFFEYYDKQLSEDEIGYIALNFALALERQRKNINRKNILLVCSSGKGSAELLAYKYKEIFGGYIKKISTCSVYDLKNIDFKDIDYIFSTVPINIKIPVPIQEIQYFLEDNDLNQIKKILDGENKGNIIDYYDENLFLTDIDFNTKDDILKYMCNHIGRYKKIPEKFYESIKKREKLGITEFGNKIAMPHPDRTLTEETFVCVGILKSPVIWDKKYVQVIFLVSVSKKTDKNLKYFYKITSKFLLNPQNIEKLIRKKNFEDLILMLREIEYEMEMNKNG